MDLLEFAFHSLVSTPTIGLERIVVEGWSDLKNIANNYVEECEGGNNSEKQRVTENGHHVQEEKDIDCGRLLWHTSVYEGNKNICQNHNVEGALNDITKLKNSTIMSGDKLSKNGLNKPKNERETNFIRSMILMTKGGGVPWKWGCKPHE